MIRTGLKDSSIKTRIGTQVPNKKIKKVIKMKVNIKKLKEISKKEVKRRSQAIKLLEKITEELSHPLEELLGDVYYEEVFNGFVWIHRGRGLYFRFKEHREKQDREEIGFYITTNELPIWGSPLEEIKGKIFWQSVVKICEWIENLPTFIEEHASGRENTLSYLKKIAECIEAAKEKNRSE